MSCTVRDTVYEIYRREVWCTGEKVKVYKRITEVDDETGLKVEITDIRSGNGCHIKV